MKESSSTPHLKKFLVVFAYVLSCFSTTHGQSSQVIAAKVGEQTITQQEVDDSVSGQVHALQQQLFALRKAALNNLISKKLLEQEAARQRLSVDQLKDKWMSGRVVVDAGQVNDLYQKNLPAFGLISSDEAKEKLRLDLEAQTRLKRYRDELVSLRQKTRIDVLMEEPRLAVSRNLNPATALGPANAKVVITEFSDFQCPYCKEAQSTLRRVVKQYSSDVRLEFKNFPIETHPLALNAARAAYCAGTQGAFWAVHDALFAAKEPSKRTIREMVRELNLNAEQFDVCWSAKESLTAVTTDLDEGRRLGVEGTPTFIINGKLLRGAASFEEFSEAIEHELKNAQIKSSTSQN